MSEIGKTNNTGTVHHSPQTTGSEQLQESGKVARGNLDGDNLRYTENASRNDLLQGQSVRAPTLEQPQEIKPTQLQSASETVGDISQVTNTSVSNVLGLVAGLQAGQLTPELQQKLQGYTDTLGGASAYLGTVRGDRNIDAESSRTALAGMGYSGSQIDGLLSLADPEKSEAFLTSLHGGQESLQQKRDALKSLGFSDEQVDTILSLARVSPENDLNSLESYGFNESEVRQLTSLLNGGVIQNEVQRAMLTSIGISENSASVVLAAADQQSLKAQAMLSQLSTPEQLEHLQDMTRASAKLAAGKTVPPQVLEQLVDIFTVLELLHEMSVQGRRTARETRSMEYDAAKEEILTQADEVRKAAVYTLAAGVASGTMKIAAGAVAIGGSMGGGSAAESAARMQRAAQASQMFVGIGDISAAGFNYQASEHQSRQKESEAFQKTHDNAAQSSSEWMQLHQDMVKTVQSKMDEIIRSWFETLKTTTRA